MKNLKNLLVITALFLTTFSFSFAGGEKVANLNSCSSTELVDQIKQELEFPQLTEQYGYEAEVTVEFEIDTEGKINLISTDSDSEMFNIHVKESLDGMEVNTSLDHDCGIYQTTINF